MKKKCLINRIKLNPILVLFLISASLFITVEAYSQEKVRVACVGNSITYGARIEGREKNSYPAQLAEMLGDAYDVRNYGKSGATLLRRGNAPYWDSPEYKLALEYTPDWVFIKLGTNDSKPMNRVLLDSFVQDYKDMIASFRRLPSPPRVVLLLPAPVFSTDTTGISSNVVREKLLPMVRQVAYESECEVINLHNLLIESPELFPDKVHPSAAGAMVIAKRLYELVKMNSDASFDLSKALPEDAVPFNFYGFSGSGFTFKGREAKIVFPKHLSSGRPWVWRARFWGHEPQTDIALLEMGFHVVYCDVAELFGNEEALTLWDEFYQFLNSAGFAQKAVMEGMSRGGVYIYRWAERYPERVAAIYADAPVLDLKSWPGGKGSGKGSPDAWEIFKKDFNFNTEEEALAFDGNPLDLAGKLARAGFPMLHVVGDADESVPVSENTAIFEQKIRQAGGEIKVIHKPGVGHHPHSLQNPQPIVDFVLRATEYLLSQETFSVPITIKKNIN